MNHNSGCRCPKHDIRNYKIRATSQDVKEIPAKYSCKIYPDKVKNQGIVGSCVPHAVSSVLEYHNKGKNKLSTNFIYGVKKQLFNDRSQGMYLSDACKVVSTYGDMLESDCSGNDEVPYCFYKADEAFSNPEKLSRAYTFRINSYFQCETVDDIQLAIQKYGPVVACIKWYDDCYAKSDGTFIYDKTKKYTYHCIMIYGWDERGLYCQNSFGKSWGHNGYFILPFTYEIADARALVDEYNPEEESLIIPKVNKFTNIVYKIVNWFLNIFKKHK